MKRTGRRCQPRDVTPLPHFGRGSVLERSFPAFVSVARNGGAGSFLSEHLRMDADPTLSSHIRLPDL